MRLPMTRMTQPAADRLRRTLSQLGLL